MALISCLRYQSRKTKNVFFFSQKIVNHSFAQHERVPFTETVIPIFTLRFTNILSLKQQSVI